MRAGGVAGGSILQGVLKLGDMIEVRPGIVTKARDLLAKLLALLCPCACRAHAFVCFHTTGRSRASHLHI